MATNAALDAIRAFESKSEQAQEHEVLVTATSLMLLDNRNVSLAREGFEAIARELLRIGRVRHFINLQENRRIRVIDTYFSSTPIETLFLINDAKQDVEFVLFMEDKHISFEEFDTELFHHFDRSFRNFGSDDFRKSLYRYFQAYGTNGFVNKNGNVVTASGAADEYMALASFVFRQVYGEEKVMNLLDRTVRERSPIRALDFIKLIKSRDGYSQYPLTWAVTLV